MNSRIVTKSVGNALRAGKKLRASYLPSSSSSALSSATRITTRCHSSYEYPNRTEAPIITRSVASSSMNEASSTDTDGSASSTTTTTNSYTNASLSPAYDPFDDTNSLSPSERRTILDKQNDEINSALPSTFTIETEPPHYIPANLPQTSMSIPSTEISTLPNGIRVASQETYGQVTTFGIISDCGSRLESAYNATTGVNHLMELLAFSGTPTLDATEFQTKLDSLGGVSFANSSREQFLYCIDVLRPNVKEAMGMLTDAILEPRLDDVTVEEMKRVVEFQWMDMVPEVVVGEGLQIAGYGPMGMGPNETGILQQQLGKSHFCPLKSLPTLNAGTVQQFRTQHLLNPKSMVICAAGMQHDQLVQLAEKHFGHIEDQGDGGPNKNGVIPSEYTGGSHRQMMPTPDGFTRVALAFPTGGWHSDDLVPACVLQTLLGGGSSFSAGGPGKGMYSRLYRQVLNRYYWAESCEAFTSFHNESGLLGISGSSIGTKAGDVTKVLAENMMRLALDEVSDEELDRARNMLKCNVLTQLESRLVLFEDIGRQLLTYGKREDTESMCKKIDDVDKKMIKELVRRSVIGMKPTLCTVGDDVSYVPAFEQVEQWFAQLK